MKSRGEGYREGKREYIENGGGIWMGEKGGERKR